MAKTIELRHPRSNIKVSFELDDNIYEDIFRVCESRCRGGYSQIVSGILKLSNWNPIINKNVNDVFNKYDIDKEELGRLFKNKFYRRLPAMKTLIGSGKIFSIVEVLKPIVQPLTPDYENLIKDLYYITEQIDGKAVGPGEILLTMFTRAVKSDKNTGDLYFPCLTNKYDTDIGSHVEIKSSQGRIGQTNFALSTVNDNTFHKIAKANGICLYDIERQRQLAKFNDWDFMADIRRVEKAREGKLIDESFAGKYINNIQDIADYGLTKNTYENNLQLSSQATETKLTPAIEKSFWTTNRILKNLNELENGESYTISWNRQTDALFFSGIKYKDYIDAFMRLRTERLSNDETKSLRKGVEEIITEDTIRQFIDNDNKSSFRKLVLCLQLTSYSIQKKFDYLLVCDKIDLNSIGIEIDHREKPSKIFISIVYQLFKKHKEGIVIPDVYSIDSRNNGVGIKLKMYK